MNKNEKFRVNIIMPITLVQDIDKLANEIGVNRTVLINMTMHSYVLQRELAKKAKTFDQKNSREKL